LKLRRFFAAKRLIAGETAILLPEQSRHLRDVLRLEPGDAVELFDGEGNRYHGIVEDCGPEVRIGRVNRLHSFATPLLRIVLAAGLIKQDRFEWMLQKGTELGADEFVPLATLRSNIRLPEDRLEARLQRWHRIVREAARQSGRSEIPVIRPPIEFGAFLGVESRASCAKLLFFEGAEGRLTSRLCGSDRAVLCIGPEGGWDPTEIAAAREAGFTACCLGSRTLRSETAAVAAMAVLQFLVASLASGSGPASDPGSV
jgi:16S rRNA (uracil1498-N3)-methyltransferase